LNFFTAEAQRREETWVRDARGMPALAGMKMQVRRVDRKKTPSLCGESFYDKSKQ
jgi:hypothetical protein